MKFTLRKKEELLVMKETIHVFETKKVKLSKIITSMQTFTLGKYGALANKQKPNKRHTNYVPRILGTVFTGQAPIK